MRRLLFASLGAGAFSALLAWVSLISEFMVVRTAVSYLTGWYVFWGSLAVCTIAALVSAFAGWEVFSRPTSSDRA
jgi:hypothetical protein